eukprot:2919807-Prymnesium_polylepis.1
MQASCRLERLRGVNNCGSFCELDENRCPLRRVQPPRLGCSRSSDAEWKQAGPPKPSHFAPHA